MPKLRRHRGHIHGAFSRSTELFGAAGSRRNPGRMDGATWNSSKMFVCPAVVDGDYDGTDSEDEIPMVETDPTPVEEMAQPQPMTISILEIARPTRLKGVAKEFEVVRRPYHVIALEDEEHSLDEDDWERIYATEVKEKRTYSAVLLR